MAETNDDIRLGKIEEVHIEFSFLFLAAMTVFLRVAVMIVFGASTGLAGLQHNRDDQRIYTIVLPYDL